MVLFEYFTQFSLLPCQKFIVDNGFVYLSTKKNLLRFIKSVMLFIIIFRENNIIILFIKGNG